MFEIIDVLIAAGSGLGAAAYLMKKEQKNQAVAQLGQLKEDASEKIVQIHHEIRNPSTPIKKVSQDITNRLDLLEDWVNRSQPTTVSTELLFIKTLAITEGVRYHFHYLNRPQPFITLTYHADKQQVSRDYMMEELNQDKKRLRDVVKQINDKIIEEHALKVASYSEYEHHPDPVYQKAHHVLKKAQMLRLNLLPSESEQTKTSVKKILDAYEPLKEETKKELQDDVFLALNKIEQQLVALEENLEREKIKRLKEEINGITP